MRDCVHSGLSTSMDVPLCSSDARQKKKSFSDSRSLTGLRTNATNVGGISYLFELWAESISVYSLAWRLVAPLLVPVKSVAAVAMGNAANTMNIFAC